MLESEILTMKNGICAGKFYCGRKTLDTVDLFLIILATSINLLLKLSDKSGKNSFNSSIINLSGYKKLNGSQLTKEDITYILNSLKSEIQENKMSIVFLKIMKIEGVTFPQF